MPPILAPIGISDPQFVLSVSTLSAEAGSVVNISISFFENNDEIDCFSCVPIFSSKAIINLLFFVSGMSASTVPGLEFFLILSLASLISFNEYLVISNSTLSAF
ncbi:hypothetical protein D3C78_1068530 [compost metagenome]